ncbi:MAG TPA: sigma-70 family RNA polymerase sigma factor [Solirubrobacterales bacterium]|nr:sigma-70 family RNA polymerase sigma factor [Solirubrobacterales bacterium]
MEAASAERAKPRPDDAARKRAAVETYARHEAALRRTAHRYSFCADDADDALQRGLEILLRKAPTADPRELVKWMQTVVKHEALAIRRDRERVLAGPAAVLPAPDAEDWVALLPSGSDGPEERLERREEIARSREALQALKPQELRALTLLAEGYSYAEIGEITSWTRTKINRCLAEGRERFRSLVARTEDGRRCQEMRPLLSAFCDGEATPEEAATLREHLRACASCRATLRTYRAAPAAAAALAPALPLSRSLWQRLHEALADAPSRFGGGRGEALSGIAGSGGAGGLGLGGLAKVAVVCVCAAGGVTAGGAATGLLSSPLDSGASSAPPVEQPRGREGSDLPQPETPAAADSREPAEPDRASKPQPPAEPLPRSEPAPEPEPVPAEPAPVEAETVEPSPAPAPAPTPVAEPAPAPAPSSSSASPAGEFGP